MENTDRVIRGLTTSDVDIYGNVVLWDHGPQEPRQYVGDAELQRLEIEHKEWHRKNGDGPVPLRMHQSDAAHAMSVEPLRYSLEPDGASESDIEAEIENIRKQRIEAEKVAAERAEAAQLVLDRKAAIAIVMAKRSQPKPADEPEPQPEPEQIA